MTSRKLAEANSANTAKLGPLPLARSTRVSEVLAGPGRASWNAIHSSTGSSTTRPMEIWVRRLASCRASSTRSRKVPAGPVTGRRRSGRQRGFRRVRDRR